MSHLSDAARLIATIRREALEEARDRIMSLQADTSATAEEHKLGLRIGHSMCRNEARDLINEMLNGA